MIGKGRCPINEHRHPNFLQVKIRAWEQGDASMYPYALMQTHEIPRVM